MLSQAKGFTRQEHEFMQDIAKKDYEDDLPELRLLFLGKTDTIIALPHFSIPTYLTRMELAHDGIQLQFTNTCRTSLAASEHLSSAQVAGRPSAQ
jgi:hypothetical protein